MVSVEAPAINNVQQQYAVSLSGFGGWMNGLVDRVKLMFGWIWYGVGGGANYQQYSTAICDMDSDWRMVDWYHGVIWWYGMVY